MIVRLSESTDYRPGAVSIDQPQFSQKVDRQPYSISHELSDHPLLQLEKLVELSQRLPSDQREYVFAKQEFGTHEDLDQYHHAQEGDELSTEQMIQNIEKHNTVIVLRNVESDPVYGLFVHECLNDLKSQIEPWTGPISGRESFIFISPPRAYTPYHYDPEQNFFLQVRGQKQMAIYDVADREVLPETALETYYSQGQKVTNCPKELFDRYELFDMQPGDGVYVPVTAPHWVRTLDDISISISINFRTPSSVRRDRVYRVNSMMRKSGLRPAPVSPQADSFADRTKSSLLGLPARMKKMIRR
jgi:hypothetical protein